MYFVYDFIIIIRRDQGDNVLVSTPVHGSSKRECGLLPTHTDI